MFSFKLLSLLLLFSSSCLAAEQTCSPLSHEVLYFDIDAGRAESIRILLHVAGVEFKDTRFAFSDWPSLKPTTPLGSVPVLKIDDVQYCQSVALARYAAKLAGFYPDDPLEALKVDEALDSLNELTSKAPQGKDEDEKKALREEFQAGAMTQYATLFESRIQASGGSGFSQSGASVADVVLLSTVKSVRMGTWDYINPAFFDAFPGIIAATKAIEANPKVAAYYASIQTKK